ncbi:MAG: branched-chain amino acid ABC transporter permease [Pedosphaera sp.]|nr:branched-chain amino acid ABC transporter permease [Pedosphaera sp.]
MFAGSKRYLIAAILFAAALSPLLSWIASAHPSKIWDRYYLGIAIDIGINIILAVSLNLINGHTGQFSLGHAGFMAVGAYTAASLTWGAEAAKTSPLLGGIIFALALLAGGGTAAVAGLAVGVPSLRLRGDYLAIVTLGFGEIIRVILQTTDTMVRNWELDPTGGLARLLENMGGASGMKGIATLTNFGWAWALAAVTVFVIAALVNSTYGRGFLAVHDDEVAAGAMGINPVRYKVTAFVIGAFFAGVAGGLYAHHKQYLNPNGFDFMKSIDIVVMVILGGMGRTVGVIIAAVLLTLLPEWLRMLPSFTLGNVPIQLTDFRLIIYSLLIIGLMMARPQGLFTFGKARGGKA